MRTVMASQKYFIFDFPRLCWANANLTLVVSCFLLFDFLVFVVCSGDDPGGFGGRNRARGSGGVVLFGGVLRRRAGSSRPRGWKRHRLRTHGEQKPGCSVGCCKASARCFLVFVLRPSLVIIPQYPIPNTSILSVPPMPSFH